jgi:hypothetical protein
MDENISMSYVVQKNKKNRMTTKCIINPYVSSKTKVLTGNAPKDPFISLSRSATSDIRLFVHTVHRGSSSGRSTAVVSKESTYKICQKKPQK